MRRTNMIRVVALSALPLIFVATAVVRAEEGDTFARLNKAYQGEIAAWDHYRAYATNADGEHWPEAARLFRAVALAESVHAANFAFLIEEMGGRAIPAHPPIMVLDTRSNLVNAAANEKREFEETYRARADVARAELEYDALASFNHARSAERTHELLFEAMVVRIDEAQRGGGLIASPDPIVLADPQVPSQDYFVCTGCGCVYTLAPRNCKKCGFNDTHIVAHRARP